MAQEILQPDLVGHCALEHETILFSHSDESEILKDHVNVFRLALQPGGHLKSPRFKSELERVHPGDPSENEVCNQHDQGGWNQAECKANE